MDRIGKQDKAVIRAFTEQRSSEGYKLSTNGTTLSGYWMGGTDLAHWKNGKIHFPDTGSRSGQFVQRAVAREAPKNDLYNGRGYNPKKNPTTYRAVKWRHSSDDIEPVGKWHHSRAEALYDAYSDFAPHRRAVYEIESSTGDRKELTEKQYQKAEQWYYGSISSRESTGVGANPKTANVDARKAESDAISSLRRANSDLVAASEWLTGGDLVRATQHLLLSAFFLGEARTHESYAGDLDAEYRAQLRELVEYIRNGTWAQTLASYCTGVAANPRHKRRRRSR